MKIDLRQLSRQNDKFANRKGLTVNQGIIIVQNGYLEQIRQMEGKPESKDALQAKYKRVYAETIQSDRKQRFRWALGINLAMLGLAYTYHIDKTNEYITMQTQIHADINIPIFMRNFLYSLYAKYYNVNTEQIELPLDQYPTFSSFFTRKINRRPPEEEPNTLVSPCDGKILSLGEVLSDQCHIIKGRTYSLTQLFLGQNPQNFEQLHTFAKKNKDNKLYQLIIYLAPGDYHRFHAPTQMIIRKEKRIEGGYDPVNESSILSGKKVYHTNARINLFSQWSQGLMAMALVGALNVSRIHLFGKTILSRGEELGYFNLGSTIVLLVEAKGIEQWRVKEGDKVRYGEALFKYLI